MSSLQDLLSQAQECRTPLVERLCKEGTNCWRLFQGVAEGRPGLVIDRYGELVLAQSFRSPLDKDDLASLEGLFGPNLVYNHRGSKEDRFAFHTPLTQALKPFLAQELGLLYQIHARHKGLDPHLFLDLRAGRRWLKEQARGKSVLNLFAYSCGLGQVAHAAGAKEVWNVDFSASALQVGRDNLGHNGFPEDAMTFIQQDYFPLIWQLSGLGVKGKKRRLQFRKFSRRQFDLVCLDPPAKAKGSFQTVDLVHDYQSLFKPALLVCAEGGQLMVTNNVGSVQRQAFGQILERCAQKAGRPLKSLDWLEPDADFPSFDGHPPLKIAVCGL